MSIVDSMPENEGSILAHLRNAVLLLIFFGLIFTLLRGDFPFPEDFSPYGFALASLIGFYKIIRVKKPRIFWTYLAIPLFSLVGFLEEISYGVESGLLQPIYWERFDVNLYDAHNIIPFLVRQLGQLIGLTSWNPSLFGEFLTYDIAFLIAGMALFLTLKLKPRSTDIGQSREVLIAWLSLAIFLLSSFSLWTLLELPTDPKNAWFLGFSLYRTLAIAFFSATGIPILVFALLLAKSDRRRAISKKIVSQLQRDSLGNKILAAAKIIILFALAFQLIAPFNVFPEKLVQLERLTPIIMWSTGVSIFVLIVLFAWGGEFSNAPMALSLLRKAKDFFREKPGYIYMSVAVSLVLFAQLIDRDWISLNRFLYPSFAGIQNWSLWIEEIFEAVGGIQLVVAALLIPIKTNRD